MRYETLLTKLRNDGHDLALEERSNTRYHYLLTNRTGSIHHSVWLTKCELEAWLDGFRKSEELLDAKINTI